MDENDDRKDDEREVKESWIVMFVFVSIQVNDDDEQSVGIGRVGYERSDVWYYWYWPSQCGVENYVGQCQFIRWCNRHTYERTLCDYKDNDEWTTSSSIFHFQFVRPVSFLMIFCWERYVTTAQAVPQGIMVWHGMVLNRQGPARVADTR